MKISKPKQMNVRAFGQPAQPPLILDEFHLAAPALDLRAFAVEPRSPRLIATQAVIERNSGKKLRLISSVRLASGDPVRPTPKKFLPAQVLRRQSQS